MTAGVTQLHQQPVSPGVQPVAVVVALCLVVVVVVGCDNQNNDVEPF